MTKALAATLAVWLVVAQGQPPVFRVGANYVRVDAYPTLDGRIIQGLTKDDFELFEDGKPQTISSSEFVTLATPDDRRGSMLSARAGLELAADPSYRVVIIVIDRALFDLPAWQSMRQDLHELLESLNGPRDLVGLITTDRPWTDLVIGRSIQAIENDLDTPEWLHAAPQESTAVLRGCELDGLRGRIRADETYALLEGAIRLLGQVRDDRTSLVFVSNGLSRVPPDRRYSDRRKGSLLPPKMGLVNGRIQRLPQASDMHDRFCQSEGARLADTDFDRRFSELVASARASNVAFYPVAVEAPMRLFGGPAGFGSGRGPMRLPAPPSVYRVPETLVDLADSTTGYLIAAARDMRAGLLRVTSDSGPHYLLGYYTTNNKRDGKVRTIKVRLKKNGAVIQARKYYRGPGKEDLAKSAAPLPDGPIGPPAPVADALGALSRLRTSTQFFTYGALAGQALTVVIEVPAAAVKAGRWKDGAALEVLAETDSGAVVGTARARLLSNGRATLRVPIEGAEPPTNVFVRLRADGESVVERASLAAGPSTLVGDPQAYRSGPRGLAIPVAGFEFTREERLKLDWPVLKPLDHREIRLLDRNGAQLKHRVTVNDQEGAAGTHLVADMGFTALGRGDYVVELEATAGGVTERKLLAFRVR